AIPHARRLLCNVNQAAQVGVAQLARPLALGDPAARFAVVHVFLGDRLPITRPAGAGIELRRGAKERRIAADATEDSLLVQVPVGTGEGSLRAVLARDLERQWRQLLSPLVLRLDHLRDADLAL